MPSSRNIVQRLLKGQSFREWLVEFTRFCIVGLGSYVVDVGLFNLLAHSGLVSLPGDASMVAKTISVSVAVIFSWVTNRLWTFRTKRSSAKTREFVMFVLVNLGGMLIALACLWVSRYGLGLRSQFADNISANVVGLVLGTAFRYVMYRYVVFDDNNDDDIRTPDSAPLAS
ncbi:MAG: GtrA family protein [Ancrocorticia sp.]